MDRSKVYGWEQEESVVVTHGADMVMIRFRRKNVHVKKTEIEGPFQKKSKN